MINESKKQVKPPAKEATWYDHYYTEVLAPDHAYLGDIEGNPYYTIWQRVLSLISKRERILDFGCGPGQFAELAMALGKSYIAGMDFSKQAIMMARERNPGMNKRFLVRDLREASPFTEFKYDVAVLLEVLEHVDADIRVVSSIPSGRRVIFSVPTSPGISHVRFFPLPAHAQSRYAPFLDFTGEQPVMTHVMSRNTNIFLFDAVRK